MEYENYRIASRRTLEDERSEKGEEGETKKTKRKRKTRRKTHQAMYSTYISLAKNSEKAPDTDYIECRRKKGSTPY